ncbi:MAG: hypothetical protein CMF48_05660 [Legionellales bacterium]|nr:hypothetical protein [Legionellales bacterium]
MKQSIRNLSVMSLLALFSLPVSAMPVKLVLDFIEVANTSETRGDELYFNVTSYGKDRDYDHYQVPSFPTHWFSDRLEEVKDVVLWEKDLEEGESVELIVSLTERDVPPWNIDDLIGSIKVKVMNDDDDLAYKWSLYADRGDTELLEQDDENNVYKMTGDDSEYTVSFTLYES